MSEKQLLVASGTAGALAVLLGAFGAHGLRAFLSTVPDGEARRAWWETAAHYHLMHALAIGLSAYVVQRSASAAPSTAAGYCFIAGIVLFSGSLYAMTLTGVRALGAVTPFGGLLLIAGWTLLVVSAWRLPP
jgi:uncharacterized membrane protein YgdD (TMEM256/DUF423 family)